MREETVAENAWRIEDGLYRILLPLRWAVPFVNVYLVESGGERMLVDCGLNHETSLRALGRALKGIGVPRRGLRYLLLTHRHPDHASGAGPAQARWGGRTLMHPMALEPFYPTEDEATRWGVANGVEESLAREFARRRPQAQAVESLPQEIDPLDEATALRLGDLAFEIVHVPGHASGQVMLREAARGWLFSADQVVEPNAPNVWHNPLTRGDPLGEYLESLERTAKIEARLVLRGHGMPMQGGLQAHVERQLRFQRRYLREVLGCTAEEPRSTFEVAQRVDHGARDPSTLAEVLAALVHLESEGRAARDGAGRWTRTGPLD